ncbi:MAG: kch [Gemmataceae bacterium]|nr:kch [Gemmataceae bacterium]
MKSPHRLWPRARAAGRLCLRWARTHLPRRVVVTLGVAAGLLATGAIGYRVIEGGHWSYFDGFYMTAITLTTIGYGETHDLSTAGRVFTVFLAFSGIFTLTYFASDLIRSVVTGELRDVIGRQWVDDQIANLSGHTIVCGYGRMGRIVCAELDRQNRRFVVIDNTPDLVKDLPLAHGLPLPGDATTDELLRKAGVERAKALITVVGSDSANLYITLTARLLNPKLLIVARAEEEEAEAKLRKVGANKVISPYLAGGHRAVQAVYRPTVLHFMEMATRSEFLDLQIEEVRVSPGCSLVGRTLRQTRIHQDLGVMVVGIQRPGGELVYNPPGDAVVEPEAILIALGQRRQLDQLEKLAAPADGEG